MITQKYCFDNMKKILSKTNSTLLTGLGLIIFFTLLLSHPYFPWNEPITNAGIDLQFKIRGSRNLSDNFVLVFIGDKDIAALNPDNKWMISRDYYGYLVYLLKQLGARAIGIDVLFQSNDRLYPEYDAALAEMVRSAGNVCLPMFFAELRHGYPAKRTLQIPMGYDPTYPIETLRDAAAGLGFSNFDPQRIIRKVPLIAEYQDSLFISFGFEMARLCQNARGTIAVSPGSIQYSDSAGHHVSIPVDRSGSLRLNHFGSVNNIESISFVDLLETYESNPDTLNFEDRIVFVAVTTPGVVKFRSTPLSDLLPATLIHATVVENILNGNYLRTVPTGMHWLIIVLLVIAGWLIFRAPGRLAIFMSGIGVIGGYWLLTMMTFRFANLALPLFYPSLAFFGAISFILFRRNIEQRLEHYALNVLLSDQIRSKELQLKSARAKLSEVQAQLSQETFISEQTRQLAEERENTIRKLEKDLRDLQTYIVPSKQSLKFAEIIYAENSKMAQVLDLVRRVCSDDIPVLIMGETGTGKEMVARAIHQCSNRKEAPFVAINCGALSETLLESELFGHEKGSFTGAHSRRRGRFELADGGTIFLDEISETSAAFQTRLLRVLQQGSFERLGGEQTIQVDVRVIAATNKDLHVEMEHHRFRSDLFYRLNGFSIVLPPLRERREDIPLLAMHFLKKHGYSSINAFSDRCMELLTQYPWHGNVRELENAIRRAAIIARSEQRQIIREQDLPEEILKASRQAQATANYTPLEDQILEMLRSLEFSRSAISQTAKALGNRDRGTITEYLRGICFQHLVRSDFDIEQAAQTVAGTTEATVVKRVANKITEYLNNLASAARKSAAETNDQQAFASAFRGLPGKFHPFLQQVIEHLRREMESE